MLDGWSTAPSDEAWMRRMLALVRDVTITGLAHTALHVADVDAAVAWYRDVLGLTRAVAAVPDGRRSRSPPTWASSSPRPSS